ncbi:MAG: radical SAM protein [Kiritimatiellia bacterium]
MNDTGNLRFIRRPARSESISGNGASGKGRVWYVVNVEVCETFTGIQGESSYAGLTCYFIRLAGCNLQCRWCDTPQALLPGRITQVKDLVKSAIDSNTSICEITGGEPLLQSGFRNLSEMLCEDTKKPVLVETNGTRDISAIPEKAVTIMDVKCPGSGEGGSLLESNIGKLRPQDEIKFVLTGRADYEWARDFVDRRDLHNSCREVLFAPADGMLEPRELAEWITADGTGARLQVQLHRIIGVE